jgi:hypothetical protein
MKRFTRRLLPWLMLLVLPLAAPAQNDPPGERSAEDFAQMQTDWMVENLGLDAAVVPVVHAINLDYARKMQEVAQSDARKLKKLRKLKTLADDKAGELRAVLTPGQFAQWEPKKAELREHAKETARERREEQQPQD